MADFKAAFLRTMKFEDDPRHPGAVTPEPHNGRARLGINSIAHPEVPTEFWTCSYEDALEVAERIFLHDYWAPLRLDDVNSQDVANKVYDMAVNMGVEKAAKYFQTACQALPDGHIGPATLATANAADPAAVVAAIRILQKSYYRELVRKNPEEYGRYLDEWLERADK